MANSSKKPASPDVLARAQALSDEAVVDAVLDPLREVGEYARQVPSEAATIATKIVTALPDGMWARSADGVLYKVEDRALWQDDLRLASETGEFDTGNYERWAQFVGHAIPLSATLTAVLNGGDGMSEGWTGGASLREPTTKLLARLQTPVLRVADSGTTESPDHHVINDHIEQLRATKSMRDRYNAHVKETSVACAVRIPRWLLPATISPWSDSNAISIDSSRYGVRLVSADRKSLVPVLTVNTDSALDGKTYPGIPGYHGPTNRATAAGIREHEIFLRDLPELLTAVGDRLISSINELAPGIDFLATRDRSAWASAHSVLRGAAEHISRVSEQAMTSQQELMDTLDNLADVRELLISAVTDGVQGWGRSLVGGSLGKSVTIRGNKYTVRRRRGKTTFTVGSRWHRRSLDGSSSYKRASFSQILDAARYSTSIERAFGVSANRGELS